MGSSTAPVLPDEMQCLTSADDVRPTSNGRILLMATLAPLFVLLWQISKFRELFWFGDELWMLNEIRTTGFFHFLFISMGENFQPVFKLIWGGLMYLSQGSYFVMVASLWLLHALTVLLFGRVLDSNGFDRSTIVFATFTMGVTWSNIETLGWTIQMSPLLSMTFFLAAYMAAQRLIHAESHGVTVHTVLFAFCCAASALCFNRGFLGCVLLSLYPLLNWNGGRSRKRLLMLSGIAALVAFAFLVITFLKSEGNHHTLAESSGDVFYRMFLHGISVFGLNPLVMLLKLEYAESMLVSFLTFKLAIVGAGLYIGYGRSRVVFLTLLTFLLFDIGNAGMIGIGRFHEGIRYSISSRYQYPSLIFFLPFLGTVVSSVGTKIAERFFGKARHCFSVVALLVWVICIATPWDSELDGWSMARGTEGRRYFIERQQAGPPWWGHPQVLSLKDANRVVRRFHLH